jgi:hypothetical protein
MRTFAAPPPEVDAAGLLRMAIRKHPAMQNLDPRSDLYPLDYKLSLMTLPMLQSLYQSLPPAVGP